MTNITHLNKNETCTHTRTHKYMAISYITRSPPKQTTNRHTGADGVNKDVHFRRRGFTEHNVLTFYTIYWLKVWQHILLHGLHRTLDGLLLV